MATMTLFLATACGPMEPLLVGIEETTVIAAERLEGWGTVLRIQVRMENRGDAPIHVFTDLLYVLGENGSHGTVRDFRDRYRMQQVRMVDAERRNFESMFDRVGIQGGQVRELVQAQTAVPAGQIVRRTLPFLLKGAPADTRYALDFAYHDDATDRITRLNLSVKAQ